MNDSQTGSVGIEKLRNLKPTKLCGANVSIIIKGISADTRMKRLLEEGFTLHLVEKWRYRENKLTNGLL